MLCRVGTPRTPALGSREELAGRQSVTLETRDGPHPAIGLSPCTSTRVSRAHGLPHAAELEGDELPGGLFRPVVDRRDFGVQLLQPFPFVLVEGDPALQIRRQPGALQSQLVERLLDVASQRLEQTGHLPGHRLVAPARVRLECCVSASFSAPLRSILNFSVRSRSIAFRANLGPAAAMGWTSMSVPHEDGPTRASENAVCH